MATLHHILTIAALLATRFSPPAGPLPIDSTHESMAQPDHRASHALRAIEAHRMDQPRAKTLSISAGDQTVAAVRWRDPVDPDNPDDDEDYVYLTGYSTMQGGSTFFATYKYRILPDDDFQLVNVALFPPYPMDAIGTHKAVAMAIDQRTGDLYVTGESNDVIHLQGQDFLTIKYNHDLIPIWSARSSRPDAVSDDIPTELRLFDETLLISGRSAGPNSNGFMVVLLDKEDGSLSQDWPQTASDPIGIRMFQSQSAADRAVKSLEDQHPSTDAPTNTGGSTVPTTSRDPFTIRYDQK